MGPCVLGKRRLATNHRAAWFLQPSSSSSFPSSSSSTSSSSSSTSSSSSSSSSSYNRESLSRGRKHNPAKIAEAPYVTNVHWTNQALLNQKLREAYGATLPAAS